MKSRIPTSTIQGFGSDSISFGITNSPRADGSKRPTPMELGPSLANRNSNDVDGDGDGDFDSNKFDPARSKFDIVL